MRMHLPIAPEVQVIMKPADVRTCRPSAVQVPATGKPAMVPSGPGVQNSRQPPALASGVENRCSQISPLPLDESSWVAASMRTVITRPVSSVASRIAPMRSGEVSTRESGMVTRNKVPTTSSDGVLAASCAEAGYRAAASNANSNRANRSNQIAQRKFTSVPSGIARRTA